MKRKACYEKKIKFNKKITKRHKGNNEVFYPSYKAKVKNGNRIRMWMNVGGGDSIIYESSGLIYILFSSYIHEKVVEKPIFCLTKNEQVIPMSLVSATIK